MIVFNGLIMVYKWFIWKCIGFFFSLKGKEICGSVLKIFVYLMRGLLLYPVSRLLFFLFSGQFFSSPSQYYFYPSLSCPDSYLQISRSQELFQYQSFPLPLCSISRKKNISETFIYLFVWSDSRHSRLFGLWSEW